MCTHPLLQLPPPAPALPLSFSPCSAPRSPACSRRASAVIIANVEPAKAAAELLDVEDDGPRSLKDVSAASGSEEGGRKAAEGLDDYADLEKALGELQQAVSRSASK